jgi:HK97 family phage major capsid protein
MPYNNVIGASQMGGMIPVEYAREIFNTTAQESAVMQLARRLPDMPTSTRVMPVQSALALAYFVNGETGLKQSTDVQWTGKTLTAEELAVVVPIPESALDDNQYPVWDMVYPEVRTAFGKAIDAAVLFGTNKPSSWPASILAGAVTAGSTVALGTGTDVLDDLLDAAGVFGLVEADGYAVTGNLAHITMKARLRGLRDSNGQPVFMRTPQEGAFYELDGTPLMFVMNGAMDVAQAHLFAGDWSQLVYAIRQDITFKVFTEGVIQDGGGNIVYNLMQQDLVALRCTFRLGFQIANPVNRINSATQYPFAALIP